MPSKLGAKPKTRMDITIDPDLQERLVKACQREERTMSNMITVALKKYLDELEGVK